MKKATATIIVTLFLASILNIALAASVTKFSASSPTEHVVINEFDQNPPGWDYEGIEWVELFNPAENDVDISGWKLSTIHGETVTVTIPEGTKIAAEEFWVYTHETQWLDDEDESIILYDADGNEIDRTRTTNDTKNDGRCWARHPNGNDTDSDTDWRFVSSRLSTKGYSNTIIVVKEDWELKEDLKIQQVEEDLKVGEKRKFHIYFEVRILFPHYDYKVVECPEFIIYSAYFVDEMGHLYYPPKKLDHIRSFIHVLPSAKLGVYDLRVKWAWSSEVFPPKEWKYGYELHLKLNITAPTSKFDTDVSLSVEEEVVSPGSSVGLEGKASVYDREGKIYPLPNTDLILVYEKPDGTTFNQSIPTGKEGEFSYYGVYDKGVWKVKARLKGDSARHEAESSWISFKVADTTPPVAHAGPDQTVKEDTLVTFDGSGSSDNIGVTSYTWTFMDVTPQTLTGVNPTYTFATPGTYTITLEVTDAAGNSATDTVVIKVFDVTNPVADAGTDRSVVQGTTVTFDGSGSTDNVGIASYTWTFTDVTPITLTGVNPSYTFSNIGNLEVTLNVSDHASNWNTDTMWVNVLADTILPTADAGLDQTVPEDTIVNFDASGSSDNIGIISYQWDFGDGTTGTGITTTHTYTSAGTYTVTLTVKDSAGNSATDSITITVEASPVEAFPLWILGAAAIIVTGIAVATTILWKKRK